MLTYRVTEAALRTLGVRVLCSKKKEKKCSYPAGDCGSAAVGGGERNKGVTVMLKEEQVQGGGASRSGGRGGALEEEETEAGKQVCSVYSLYWYKSTCFTGTKERRSRLRRT
jgi:hypothetical protein